MVYSKEYKKEYNKRYVEANKEKCLERDRAYSRNHREYKTKYFRNLRFGGNVEAVLKKYDYKCWFCQEDLHGKRHDIHHRDGLGFREVGYKSDNRLSNLVLFCARCHKKFHMLEKAMRKGRDLNEVAKERRRAESFERGIRKVNPIYKDIIKGNEEDCICHKPHGQHLKMCDAYRLAEFFKKFSAAKMNIAKETTSVA